MIPSLSLRVSHFTRVCLGMDFDFFKWRFQAFTLGHLSPTCLWMGFGGLCSRASIKHVSRDAQERAL